MKNMTENQILDILADAISDAGYWSWWIAAFPHSIQLEFGGTYLNFPPSDTSEVLNSRIALKFKNPKSVSFISKQEHQTENNKQWFDQFHNDELGNQTCSYGEFSFTNHDIISSIVSQAIVIDTIHGYSPNDKQFMAEKYQLAFWAGEFGIVIAADEIKFLGDDGIIELEQIPKLNEQWWTYWKKYHELRNSENALPIDYRCELTIPFSE
ncbi:MAG: hypothetical protein IPM69_03740 [Ignavibacteria bacterium]|nr:hypothetical protein [Ignavibacteria bacterium]